MVDIKQAVEIAIKYFIDITGPSDRVRVEETEAGTEGDRSVWRITLSRPNSEVFEFVRGRPARDYKLLLVDRDSGEVISMKIRELAGV